MSTPAIIYLLINIFCLGVVLVKHGEPITINFFSTLFLWVFITLPLLYWGGFFD